MENQATLRVASFYLMVLAHLSLTDDDTDTITKDTVLDSFMGSGASDQLRMSDIMAFLKEQGINPPEFRNIKDDK